MFGFNKQWSWSDAGTAATLGGRKMYLEDSSIILPRVPYARSVDLNGACFPQKVVARNAILDDARSQHTKNRQYL